MPGQDLGIAQRHARVQGVGDRRMARGVWGDVARDPSGRRDPGDHPVAVAPSIGFPDRGRSTGGPSVRSPRAGLEDPKNRDGQRHGGGLADLADEVQDPVSADGRLTLPLDRGSLHIRRSADPLRRRSRSATFATSMSHGAAFEHDLRVVRLGGLQHSAIRRPHHHGTCVTAFLDRPLVGARVATMALPDIGGSARSGAVCPPWVTRDSRHDGPLGSWRSG